jgi:hypothetical protein
MTVDGRTLHSQVESVLASEVTGKLLKLGDKLSIEDELIERSQPDQHPQGNSEPGQ